MEEGNSPARPASETGTGAAPADNTALQQALSEQKALAEKYLANWQRAQADLQNHRKLIEQERTENARFANLALIRSLLPVLDDLERAFKQAPREHSDSPWLKGLALVQRKLLAALESQGVSTIDATGQSFDPAMHEAVAQLAGEEGMVIDQLQKGYKLHDRVIRPARVAVGKGTDE